ncbi:MAG: hypothetical protein J6M18_01960 [Actinomycetaceae bacterium]|nr:hypothetical protein [Actinomycetaceae bacterium]
MLGHSALQSSAAFLVFGLMMLPSDVHVSLDVMSSFNVMNLASHFLIVLVFSFSFSIMMNKDYPLFFRLHISYAQWSWLKKYTFSFFYLFLPSFSGALLLAHFFRMDLPYFMHVVLQTFITQLCSSLIYWNLLDKAENFSVSFLLHRRISTKNSALKERVAASYEYLRSSAFMVIGIGVAYIGYRIDIPPYICVYIAGSLGTTFTFYGVEKLQSSLNIRSLYRYGLTEKDTRKSLLFYLIPILSFLILPSAVWAVFTSSDDVLAVLLMCMYFVVSVAIALRVIAPGIEKVKITDIFLFLTSFACVFPFGFIAISLLFLKKRDANVKH